MNSLMQYPAVEICDIEVADAKCADQGFAVTLRDGTTVSCRKLLLATGVTDRLPPIDGFQPFYGVAVVAFRAETAASEGTAH